MDGALPTAPGLWSPSCNSHVLVSVHWTASLSIFPPSFTFLAEPGCCPWQLSVDLPGIGIASDDWRELNFCVWDTFLDAKGTVDRWGPYTHMAYVPIGEVEQRHLNQFIYQITRTTTKKVKLGYVERVVSGIFFGWVGTVWTWDLQYQTPLSSSLLSSIHTFSPFWPHFALLFPRDLQCRAPWSTSCFSFIKPHRLQLDITIMAK